MELSSVIAPPTFWPSALGVAFLLGGLWTYRRDLFSESSPARLRFVALGPVFVAASLAAFAGEHFTAARNMVQLVPKWLPARLFITYFVGVAHLAAALSLVARRYIRWSAIGIAILFALIVLLLWLPGAVTHPTARMAWIVTVRETTFSMGGLALLSTAVRDRWPTHSSGLAATARVWTGMVLIFYGIEHLLHPEYSPGVPDTQLTAPWVPLPLVLAYLTGILLIACGTAMFVRKYASSGGMFAGLLMVLLTIALYVPQLFLARSVSEEVTAINFVADTLLFAGTLLVITRAIMDSESQVRPLAAAAQGFPGAERRTE